VTNDPVLRLSVESNRVFEYRVLSTRSVLES